MFRGVLRHEVGRHGCLLGIGKVIVDFLVEDIEDDVQKIPATNVIDQKNVIFIGLEKTMNCRIDKPTTSCSILFFIISCNL